MVSCKEYSLAVKGHIKSAIKMYGAHPCLAVIQIDNDPASDAYVAGKKRDCQEVGIDIRHVQLYSVWADQYDLEREVNKLANDDSVHGIIIQLPVPKKYNIDAARKLIPPRKDVDGFRMDSPYTPCTPCGIIDWLIYNSQELEGSDVVVIGRSEIVGKPLTGLLIELGATVTCCNSHTKDIARYTKNADIVIVATGKPHYFKDIFSPTNKVIVDVGITKVDGKLCGDVHPDAKDYAPNAYITSVPGGVGLLTRVALLENVIMAFYRSLIGTAE